MRAARAFRSQQVRPVRFHAELVTGLNLARGVGPASFTRNTSATVFDQDNVLRTVAANEARFSGARRVQNLLAYSEDFTNAAWVKNSGTLGAKDADGFFSWTAAASTRCDISQTRVGFAVNAVASFAVEIKNINSASGIYIIVQEFSGSTYLTQSARGVSLSQSESKRVVLTRTFTSASADRAVVIVRIENNSTGGTIKLRFPQLEDATGQANKNPGEYVSTNVLSFPFHGAGVDRVKYFDTTNGNTVDANGIVTEAAGLPLAPWIYGRFGKQFITYDPWVASTAYAANAGVIPVRQNGYYYTASAGTSGTTEPAWPTTIGATVTDGTITWTCKGYYKLFGYLAEGQRTNSLLQCRNFADAAWTNSASAVTATQNAVGIDGAANTAWTLEVTDGMNQFKTQAVTVPDNSDTHTVAIWVPKTGTATYSGLGFTLTGGTTTLQAQYTFNSATGLATARGGNAAGATATVELIGGYWWVQVSCANNTTGNVTLTQGIFPCVATSDSGTWAAALTGSVVVDWAQGELGAAFASMPILTTTAAVTRSGDSLKYPVVGNQQDAAGTGYAQYASSNMSKLNIARILAHGGGETIIHVDAAQGAGSYDGASVVKGPSGAAENMLAAATTWGSGSRRVYVHGAGGTAGAYDGAFNLTAVTIGWGNGSFYFYGTIRSVKILNRPLLDAEIPAL